MKFEHIFIINPVSGKGKGIWVGKNIQDACEKLGWTCEIRYTRPDLTAKQIAEEYKSREGVQQVLWAVGGDGTLHEVLNGIMGTDHYLGLIPLGSGNDFNRTILEMGKTVDKIDVGRINDQYFLNSVCFGLDGQVANNLDRMRTRWIPASQRYTASILYTFFTHREKKLHFKYERKECQMKSTVLTVCNGRYYGGGYRIAPQAQPNDGIFECIFTDHIPRLLVIPLFVKLKRNRLSTAKQVHMEQIRNISIHAEEELVCNVDGEMLKGKEFVIEMIPGAVRFFNHQKMVDMALAGMS